MMQREISGGSKTNHCLFFWLVMALSSVVLTLGAPHSRAEAIAEDSQRAHLFHSLLTASRNTASPTGYFGDTRNHTNHAFMASASKDPAEKIQSKTFSSPILFEPNHGQTHPNAAFVARLPGTNVFFTAEEIVLAATRPTGPVPWRPTEPESTVLRFRFEGVSPGVRIEAHGQATARSHYMIRRSPGAWHTNIPVFTEIVYKNLYPGIDLRLHGSSGKLEYDFVVAPGADPDRIRIKLLGANKSAIDPRGNLITSTMGKASLIQKKPLSYQDVGTERVIVASQFNPKGDHRFGFLIGPYNRSRPLVIDPVLDFSSFIGGARFDKGADIALDRQGNIYVTGQTQSTDFPLEDPLYAQAGGSFDIFVLKFNPSGSELIYSTYIAGSQLDIAYAIAVDAAGSAYLTGQTSSDDFPSTRVLGTAGSGAFILKLSPDGSSIVYSTLFGGSSLEKGYDVAVDELGNAYVTGLTASTNFPTQHAAQSQRGGGFDAFVASFGPSGSLIYSTYLGGSRDDNLSASSSGGIAIAIDDAGNAYVTGDTRSTDFPTLNAFQPFLAGEQDAFVAKLGPTGSLMYSTYLGGSDVALTFGERGFGIGVDRDGNAYVSGGTRSTDFPTLNAIQDTLGGGIGDQDFFVSVLNPQGTELVYSTYLGGKFAEASVAGGLAVDRCGNVFVAGTTNSSDFALENLSGAAISGTRVFLAKLEAGGARLLYAANVGHGSSAKVALGPDNSAYLSGHTASSTFPAVNAYQPARAGNAADAFVAKVSHLRTVGDHPGEYRVCGNEPIQINVVRNLAADPGREWFAFMLTQGGIPTPIFFMTDAGFETYTPGTAPNSYTPFSYTGNVIVPRITLDALDMDSGDQLVYAYLYEKDGVLNLEHIVFVTSR